MKSTVYLILFRGVGGKTQRVVRTFLENSRRSWSLRFGASDEPKRNQVAWIFYPLRS